MITLTPDAITLNATVADKADAIRQVGRLLVTAGYIDPRYVESLLGREAEANTYLGNGIAIPHGMRDDRDWILTTGIAVLQVPAGVDWGDGNMVHVLVGIAAKSDEHIDVLTNLMHVLDDEDQAEALAKTDDPQAIIDALTADRSTNGTRSTQMMPLAEGVCADVTIQGEAGLHARPATLFIETAQTYAATVEVAYAGRRANGKALGSLLKLGVKGGGRIRITTSGPDAEAALAALVDAVEAGLGEADHGSQGSGAAAESGGKQGVASPTWTPVSEGRWIGGVPASPGLAVGPVLVLAKHEIRVQDHPESPAAERHRLAQALEAATEQLRQIHDAAAERLGKDDAAIFKAHQALLADDELVAAVHAVIDEGHSAAWAWQQTLKTEVQALRGVDDERLAARGTDLHDVGQRVLRVLAGVEAGELQLPDTPVILLAEDLTPSDTARLDPQRILALVTAAGGPTSHTAIIARSLDIPAAVGAGEALYELADGTVCILDGAAGRLFIDPSPEDFASAEQFRRDLQAQREREHEARYEPAIFTDGHRVEVVANIGAAPEAITAVEAGSEGVGLLRTEFLFLGRDTAPTEDEQVAAYTAMTAALNGLPLIIRTLDIGGDKVVPYLHLPAEENPFLGVRGIRLCMRQPELFLPQLRAIYRASLTGPVKIMFPMIATLEELREAKAVAEKVRLEIGAPPVEIGIMVEVPSTALMATEFAKEVDFFSIGTNDLTQYTLAMDRMHPALARQVDGLHPAVLRLIDMTVKAADAAGKWVGVCGGVAGDPLGATILTGLGVRELSMSIPSVPAVKAHLRTLSRARAASLATRALACGTAAEVRALAL